MTTEEAVNLAPELLEILACPNCHAPLRPDVADLAAAQELICTSAACGLRYPVRDGIPVLLLDEARRPPQLPTSG